MTEHDIRLSQANFEDPYIKPASPTAMILSWGTGIIGSWYLVFAIARAWWRAFHG